jgi:hypothetical protein
MKKKTILFVYLLLLGCKNGDTDPFTNGRGVVIGASFNGKPWENSKLRLSYETHTCSKSLGLNITVSNAQGFERESLYITKIPLAVGEFSIKKYTYNNVGCLPDSPDVYSTYNTSQDDGDVGKDNYDILESSKEINKLVINKYDGKSKYISGEFSATFLLKRNTDGSKRYFGSVDTIRITKARFEAWGF